VFFPAFILFATLTGLADGLALKELRYAADACDSPQRIGSPDLRAYWERRFSEGGTLANAKTENGDEVVKAPGFGSRTGRGPSRGLSFSGPVSRILS